MLTIGTKGMAETAVTEKNTAKAMGSGNLPVYATPSMIALMESAASGSIVLPEGQGTVGTLMNVSHLSASPLTMKIKAESELTEIDGKRLVFAVLAYDDCGLIGRGVHERFIIDDTRFMEKAQGKLCNPPK